jgi:hypothetical protein
MPSIDEDLLLRLHDSGKVIVLAEQNNGYLWQNLLKVLHRRRRFNRNLDRVVTVNTLTAEGKPRFIHSGTYEELVQAFGLSPSQLAQTVRDRVAALARPVFPDSLT